MLYQLYQEKLKDRLKPHAFKSFMSNKIPSELVGHILEQANPYIGFDWPRMKVTDYMDYHLTGSRIRYMTIFGNNFNALTKLAMAEYVDGTGKYLPDMANGIIARCEETSWIHTAHLELHGDESFPDHEKIYMDLRVTSTGMQLALIYYLFKAQLDEWNPQITKRMEHEIKNRILDVYLDTQQWWMNFEKGHTINNWNTHNNHCVLVCALIMEKDPNRLERIVEKIMKSLDVFLSSYASDGACDEGPSYFKGAGLAFYDVLILLSETFDIAMDEMTNEKIKNMASYIYKVYIHKNYYMSYADGQSKNPMFDVKLFRVGQKMKDLTLMDMAADIFSDNQSKGIFYENFMWKLDDYMEYAFYYNDIKAYAAKEKKRRQYVKDNVLHDAHIFSSRQQAKSEKGFFVGIKGGHNDESHNHNDIGVVFVYHDGAPIIVDPGAGDYIKETFSHQRYQIWTMQSGWHNLPRVNGHEQNNGKNYASYGFSYDVDLCSKAGMNIEKAYPKEANIQKYHRQIEIQRANEKVCITDHILLEKPTKKAVWFFTTPHKPMILTQGQIQLDNVIFHYPKDLFDVTVEEKNLEDDQKSRASWGEHIYRMDFHVKHEIQEQEVCFVLNKRDEEQ